MSRHLQHIQRMELVLRLVDNEALAPEDVTDLKDLVDDYVERNQDDFDEFGDVEGKFISIIVRAIRLMSCFVYRYVRGPRAG